jgi:integrase
MRIFFKRGNYHIDFRDKAGRRYRQKVGPNKHIAELVLAKKQTEIIENKFFDIKREQKIKFEAFADEYLESYCKIHHMSVGKSSESQLTILKRSFSGQYLHEITTLGIERYKNDQMKLVSPATINRRLARLKALYNKAIEWGKFNGENPVKKVKFFRENNGRVRYLETEEITKLISNCKGNLRAIVIIAVNTGMRRSEIFGLKWVDIDFRRNLIYLLKTKNGEKREVCINENVKNALIGVRKHPKSPYIFCYKDGSPVKDIRKPWFKALKDSGITEFHFHDLRHTFCSQLMMGGANIIDVKELVGHKTLAMTLRYSHLSRNHKQKTVDDLARRLGPVGAPLQPPQPQSEQLVSPNI